MQYQNPQYAQPQHQQPQFHAPPQMQPSPPPMQQQYHAPPVQVNVHQAPAPVVEGKQPQMYMIVNVIGMLLGFPGIHELYLGNIVKGLIQLGFGSYWVITVVWYFIGTFVIAAITSVTFGFGALLYVLFVIPIVSIPIIYIWCFIDLIHSDRNCRAANAKKGLQG